MMVSGNEGANWIAICESAALAEGGVAVPFEVVYLNQVSRAFVVRYQGRVHAYLNRCTHVPMELDWQPNQIFDATGHWLLCATHGASYQPDTGSCMDGPCRGGLLKVEVSERQGVVGWHTRGAFHPVR